MKRLPLLDDNSTIVVLDFIEVIEFDNIYHTIKIKFQSGNNTILTYDKDIDNFKKDKLYLESFTSLRTR